MDEEFLQTYLDEMQKTAFNFINTKRQIPASSRLTADENFKVPKRLLDSVVPPYVSRTRFWNTASNFSQRKTINPNITETVTMETKMLLFNEINNKVF